MAKGSGYLVETKTGLLGRTYHSEKMVNGKVRVYLLDEPQLELFKKNDFLKQVAFKKSSSKNVPLKMLCDPHKLKVKGFID